MQKLYNQITKLLPKNAPSVWLLGLLLIAFATINTQAQTLLTQNFNAATGQTPPTGWTNAVGTAPPTGNLAQLWQFGTGLSFTGGGFSGNYAILNSDGYGSGNTQNAVLTSPIFDCSAATSNVILSFTENWRGGFGSAGLVQFSTNGGTTWTTFITRGATNVNGGTVFTGTVTSLDVTAQLGGQANARLRWVYTGTWAWWWGIDNVLVEVLPNLDLAFSRITSPGSTSIGCTGNQNFSVEVRNAGAQAIDFTFNPAVVTLNALDPTGSPASLSTTVNTGTLSPGATRTVVLGNYNMASIGAYTVGININMPGDQKPSNNNLAPPATYTVNSSPLLPLPQSVRPPDNFPAAGFFVNPNLSDFTGGAWIEANGASPVPANTEWAGASAAQRTGFGQNSLAFNVWSRGVALNAWVLGPRVLVDAQTRFQYDMALTGWLLATPYPLTLTSGEGIRVMISDNCGGSWTEITRFGFGSNSGLTAALQRFNIDLGVINSGAYLGREVQIGFWLSDDTAGDFNGADIHIANLALFPRDAVTVTPFTANGLATSPLPASSVNQGLVGFAMRADGTNTWNSVVMNTSQPVAGRFTNLRLVRSVDNSLATTADNTVVPATINSTATQVTISGIGQALTTTNNNYFLVADVDASVTAATLPIQFTFNQSNVAVATSFVYPFNYTSTNFSFVGILINFTSLNSTSNGIAASPLIATSINQAVFGVAVTSNAPSNLTDMVINTSSTSLDKFTSVRLVSSVDNNFGSTADNTTLSPTINVTATQIQVSGLTGQSLSATPRNYFIVVDILGTVSGTTPTIQLSNTEANATISIGTITPFNIVGTNYSFATKSINLSGSLNFGDVPIGQTATRTFDIQNTGSAPLLVSNVSYPQGYTGDFVGIVPIGTSRTVNVTFSPISITINYDGIITANSDALAGTNTIPVFGRGIARIASLSNEIAFGDVQVGEVATRILSITNTGNAPLNVTNLVYPTAFSGAFSGNIAAGATQNITVTFAPTANIFYQGNITVVSNANNLSNLIPITGRGLAPTNVTALESFGKGSLAIYPNPSEGLFNLKVAEVLKGSVKINVYNTLGKVVYTAQTEITQDIAVLNLTHLPKGSYLVEISNRKGKTTEQVIKQ